eukprot:14502458-Alexandrium_andersonii.AAC.1
MMSLAEQRYSLKKTLRVRGACATDVVSMDKAHCMDDQFIIGVDCEKLPGANFIGQNVMSGSLMILRLRNAWNGIDVTSAPEQIHTILRR